MAGAEGIGLHSSRKESKSEVSTAAWVRHLTKDRDFTHAYNLEALTPDAGIPKMTPQVQQNHFEVAMSPPTQPIASLNRFRAIATDLHFWIPLSVLIGGLLLLDRLS
jgi:hypothetical protein